MMLIESQKPAVYVEQLEEEEMGPEDYVRKKFVDYRDIFGSEIKDEVGITNVQASNLMADAENYFGFRGFLHKSNFLEEDSHFTVSQCIKLIRLQLGEYKHLLG